MACSKASHFCYYAILGIQIITIAPIWYALICAAAALFLTWLLYKNHFFTEKWKVWMMRVLRFLGLFLVFVLLLSPMFKLRLNVEKKPVLLVYKDASLSIDSAKMAQSWQQYNKRKKELQNHFDVREYFIAGDIVGSDDTPSIPNETRLGNIVEHSNDIASSDPVAAVVVFSDGIFNSGLNPLFRNFSKNTSLFTLGLGDTVQHPDIRVNDVNANSSVFINNDFSINANIRALGFTGKEIQVQLIDNGKLVKTAPLKINSNNYFTRVDFVTTAKVPGNHRFTISIAPLSGESNTVNNQNYVSVDVTDTRRKIVLCYYAPHPDIGAIKNALSGFEQYDLSSKQGLPTDLNSSDIFILHGFAANSEHQTFINQLNKAGKPFWLIYTSQSNSRYSNFPDLGVNQLLQQGRNNEVQAVINPQFVEYIMDDKLLRSIQSWPPLNAPVGDMRMSKSFKVELFQKIGSVTTEYPLMGFTSQNNCKQAWMFAEGIWRWRIRDYKTNGNSETFDAWVAGIVQYITTENVKKQFRTFTQKPIFFDGEAIPIWAEYMDQNRVLSNISAAKLSVQGGKEQAVSMSFAKNGNRYRQELKGLPPGEYKIQAVLENPKETASNAFTVVAGNLESMNTVADFKLLRLWSKRNKGSFYPAGSEDSMLESVVRKCGGQTTIASEVSVKELIHLKWLFGLIVVLFAAEWFLRKREGAY